MYTKNNTTQRFFIYNEEAIIYRITKNGLFQARYRKNGYNIEVAHRDFSAMKQKFIQKMVAAEKNKQQANYPRFEQFAAEWLAAKQHTIKPSTYDGYARQINKNLIPQFGKTSLHLLTRKEIQDYLFSLADQGKNRTAQKLKILLTAMFDVIAEDYPQITNPMRKIVLNAYEVKKGSALTKAEEKQFIDFCKENPQYQGNDSVLILMFTGMRIGELKTAQCNGTYITCISEKTRKGKKEVVRKIPVSPMLQKIWRFIDFEKAVSTNVNSIRDSLKRVFPTRHPHELRYTFITRAKECGCNPEAVMLWVGHEHDQDVRTSKVDRGYTTYSEEYLLSESKKINYEYSVGKS